MNYELADSLWRYDKNTGKFFWKINVSNKMRIGDEAGSERNTRYLAIRYKGKSYQSHNLAWLITYKVWPKNEIDHKNGNSHDNRIVNLRDITHTENLQNTKNPHANNITSKYLGVSLDHGKWLARIRIGNGKRVNLGWFNTSKEASKCYFDAKLKLHPFYVSS